MANWSGLGLIVTGATVNAMFPLPMRLMKRWAFENVWSVFSLFALVALPCALGYATVPHLAEKLIQMGAMTAALCVLGVLWGCGQACFGLALQELGMSLATAIMLGVSIAVGCGIPFLSFHRDVKASLTLLAVFVLTATGVLLCTFAGQQRPKASLSRKGLLCSMLAGFGAGLFNVAVSVGAPVVRGAIQHGGDPHFSQFLIWVPFLLCGAIPNLGFCLHRAFAGKRLAGFLASGTGVYWLYAIVMASFWLGGSVLYGVGAHRLGALGPTFAFPIYISLIVTTTTVLGLLIGEWRQVSSMSLALLHSGVFLLLVSVFLTVRMNTSLGANP